jgi:hypothetical protein
MAKVNNNTEAFEAIVAKRTFSNNRKPNINLFGELTLVGMEPSLYVAYSYGYHYPMCAYDYNLDRWFFNERKFSPTSQRHKAGVWQRLTQEERDNAKEIDTQAMLTLAMTGSYANAVANRMGHKIPPNHRATQIQGHNYQEGL